MKLVYCQGSFDVKVDTLEGNDNEIKESKKALGNMILRNMGM